MNKIVKRILLILYLTAVVGLILVIYVYPGITDAMKTTTVVEYGEIVKKTETTGWIIRDEVVYTAPASGTVHFYVKEGERVRKNTKILEVTPSLTSVWIEEGGIISFCIDGLEGVLTPETAETYSRSQYEEWTDEPVCAQKTEVTLGEKLIKLSDSLEWELVYWTTEEDSINYTVGKSVDVTFYCPETSSELVTNSEETDTNSEKTGTDSGESETNSEGEQILSGTDWDSLTADTTIPMTVKSLESQGEDGVRVILNTSRYYVNYASRRSCLISVVTSDISGLLIENSSISTEQNVQGVYVKQVSGVYSFTPINVLSTDGVYSVVSEKTYTRKTAEGTSVSQKTVSAYDEILADPSKR